MSQWVDDFFENMTPTALSFCDKQHPLFPCGCSHNYCLRCERLVGLDPVLLYIRDPCEDQQCKAHYYGKYDECPCNNAESCEWCYLKKMYKEGWVDADFILEYLTFNFIDGKYEIGFRNRYYNKHYKKIKDMVEYITN